MCNRALIALRFEHARESSSRLELEDEAELSLLEDGVNSEDKDDAASPLKDNERVLSLGSLLRRSGGCSTRFVAERPRMGCTGGASPKVKAWGAETSPGPREFMVVLTLIQKHEIRSGVTEGWVDSHID